MRELLTGHLIDGYEILTLLQKGIMKKTNSAVTGENKEKLKRNVSLRHLHPRPRNPLLRMPLLSLLVGYSLERMHLHSSSYSCRLQQPLFRQQSHSLSNLSYKEDIY